MVARVEPRFTFDQYLWIESQSPTVKHELIAGQILAMSGGTPAHSRIATNIITLLGVQLRDRTCTVFNSDLRIRVPAADVATYPDVSVVCGSLQMDPEDKTRTTVLNPCFLVEVLSPSTEAYDRSEKLAYYMQIESLQAVLLVAHDDRRLELWRRDGDRWILDTIRAGTLAVPSLEVTISIDEVYRDPTAQ
jgi:Uma2 family endonuclease